MGRFSSRTFLMLYSRSFSSSLSRLNTATAWRSASPSALCDDASMGRTNLPAVSRSFARCLSASIRSSTFISTSPSGPGTSIGRTTSPPLALIASALIRSDAPISSSAATALASASPSGPRLPSSRSFGRIFPSLHLSRSAVRMDSTKDTTSRSRSARGPPSDSMGRTRVPSVSAMRRARLPSSSMTEESQSTSCFSASPRGPLFPSAASIGLTNAGSSPIILARLSSICRSASFFLKTDDLQL
mmetsp:Transcript_23103/g.46882  ORF Transcript_23103/g.46882 Transcript_23103/m.46882 type:complete len:244 (-) Transcript_23103:321-1052(-)